MIVYTGTSWSESNQKLCAELNVGMMPTPVDPVAPDKIIPEVRIAGDNGAFNYYRRNVKFDEDAFYKWLSSIKRDMDWVALPDVPLPKDWRDSYNLSKRFYGTTGYKEYFVVQDGMAFDDVHALLSECDGCFIGGSTNVGDCSGWKWKTAPHWVSHCHEIDIPVHMGRCPGNVIGMFTADRLGIDSIDTSTLIRHQKLGRVINYVKLQREQTSITV